MLPVPPNMYGLDVFETVTGDAGASVATSFTVLAAAGSGNMTVSPFQNKLSLPLLQFADEPTSQLPLVVFQVSVRTEPAVKVTLVPVSPIVPRLVLTRFARLLSVPGE